MIRKYPRTQHLEGSRLQEGDRDLEQVSFSDLSEGLVVIEEKLDGANSAVSFEDGELRLQSRGHYLTGGDREKHFDVFKQWAQTHSPVFRERLGDRFVVYGEWLYAKHTIYYDALPHWFMEFDILDRERDVFLSTRKRRELLEGLPITSVPVVWEGKRPTKKLVTGLVRRSLYKSDRWKENLPEPNWRETDSSDDAEGVYVKVEDEDTGTVRGRYKWIRASFLQTVIESESHWLKRPIVPNRLREGADIFAP